MTFGPGTSETEGGRPEPVLTPSVADGAAATSTAAEKAGLPDAAAPVPAPSAFLQSTPRAGRTPAGMPGGPGQRPADGVRRLRKWRWPFSAAAAVIAVAVLARILAASPGGTPPLPTASHTVAASSSTTSAAGKAKNPARKPSRTPSATSTSTHGTSTPTHIAPSPTPANPSTVPAAASYASAPLATGSSLVRARVYFGQLKAVVGALAGQVTFNTPAAWVDGESGRCALTVVFAGVASPTGAVYAQGLGSGWPALEYAPSQETEKGDLHQQIVTPNGTISAGESWQPSAELIAGSLQLTSDTYSLQFQGTAGSAQTWLIDGHAVSCDD